MIKSKDIMPFKKKSKDIISYSFKKRKEKYTLLWQNKLLVNYESNYKRMCTLYTNLCLTVVCVGVESVSCFESILSNSNKRPQSSYTDAWLVERDTRSAGLWFGWWLFSQFGWKNGVVFKYKKKW